MVDARTGRRTNQGHDLPGHLGGPGGLAILVVDHVDGRTLALQVDHRAHEARPVRPVQPGRPDYVARPGQAAEHRALGRQLGPPVGGPRRWDVVLSVGPLGGPGEDVVGRRLHQAGLHGRAGGGQIGCAAAVHHQRLLLMCLGVVHGGPGRAVNDHIRAQGGQDVGDGSGVGHVKAGPVQGGHALPAAAQHGDQVTAEHAAGPGHQPPAHDACPASAGAAAPVAGAAPSALGCFSGSHQARLSRYHCTVSARP